MCKAKTWALGKANGLAVNEGIGRHMWVVNMGLVVQGIALVNTSQGRALGVSARRAQDWGTSGRGAMQVGVLLPSPLRVPER